MKILKEGAINRKPKKFVCDNCGCEFIADNTEYALPDYMECVHDAIKAKCKCPTCGKMVYNYG